MNATLNSVAIIALAIVVLHQQRALRRLRRAHRALRRDHVAGLVWYGTLFAHRPPTTPAAHVAPSPIALATSNDARIAR